MRHSTAILVAGAMLVAGCAEQADVSVHEGAVAQETADTTSTTAALSSPEDVEVAGPAELSARSQDWSSGPTGGTLTISSTSVDEVSGEATTEQEFVSFTLDNGSFAMSVERPHGTESLHIYDALTRIGYGVVSSPDGESKFEYLSTGRPTWGPDANRAPLRYLAFDYATSARQALMATADDSAGTAPLRLTHTGAHHDESAPTISGVVDDVTGLPVDLLVASGGLSQSFVLTSTEVPEDLAQFTASFDAEDERERLEAATERTSAVGMRVDDGGYVPASLKDGQDWLGADSIDGLDGYAVVEHMHRAVVSPYAQTCPETWDCDLISRSVTLSDGTDRITVFAQRLADEAENRLGVDPVDPYHHDTAAGAPRAVSLDGAPTHALALARDWVVVVEGTVTTPELVELAEAIQNTADARW